MWRCLTVGAFLMAGLLGPVAGADEPVYRLLTGGAGGTYARIGDDLTRMAAAGRVRLSPLPSPGSFETTHLLMLGLADLGLLQLDVLRDQDRGVDGTLKLVAPLFLEELHIVVRRDTRIRTLADLKGQRVAIGARGSGTAFLVRRVLQAAGLDEDTDLWADRSGLAEALEKLLDRRIEAVLAVGGRPLGALAGLSPLEGQRLRLLSLDDATRKAALGRCAVYQACTIPPGSYPGQRAPVITLGVPAALVAGPDVPASVVDALAARVKIGDPKGHAKWDERAAMASWVLARKIPATDPADPPLKHALLHILSGDSRGTYHRFAHTLEQALGEGAPKPRAEVTHGSLRNLIMLLAGEGQLGLVQEDVLLAGLAHPRYKARILEHLRLVTPLYREELHLLTRRASGAVQLAQLAGKRVSVGSTGSGTFFTAMHLLQRAGLRSGPKAARLSYEGSRDGLRRLLEGEADALLTVGGQPLGFLAELPPFFEREIRLVPLGLTAGGRLQKATLGAESYPWQQEAVASLSTRCLLIARKDLSAGRLQAMLGWLARHRAGLKLEHSKWTEWQPKDAPAAAKALGLPLHAGTEQFLASGKD